MNAGRSSPTSCQAKREYQDRHRRHHGHAIVSLCVFVVVFVISFFLSLLVVSHVFSSLALKAIAILDVPYLTSTCPSSPRRIRFLAVVSLHRLRSLPRSFFFSRYVRTRCDFSILRRFEFSARVLPDASFLRRGRGCAYTHLPTHGLGCAFAFPRCQSACYSILE